MYTLPPDVDGELGAHRCQVRASSGSCPGWGPGSNAGKSTSFWRERVSRGNVAFIDPPVIVAEREEHTDAKLEMA